jgi:hypothetical protein
MRAAALVAVLLLAGCTSDPGAVPSSTPSPAATTSVSPATPSPTVSPTASALASPVVSTVYAADDEAIAALIRASAAEAIPQIKELNKMDPQKLEDLFLPLQDWITAERSAIAALKPTTCTAAAVERFNEGIDQYDDIRKTFLAWRDWGAKNRPFPAGAPGLAAKEFEAALAELEATCAD